MPKAADSLRMRLRSLRVGKHKGRRAPHKPFLVLLAIGRCLRGEERLIPYSVISRELAILLRRFGPHRDSVSPQHPFWRLRNDGVWEVEREDKVQVTGAGDALVSSLNELDIHAGLLEDDYEALRRDPGLALTVAADVLHDHFPETLHADILEATGFPPVVMDAPETIMPRYESYQEVLRRQRNRDFRGAVLDAYEDRCAVCAFAVRHEESSIAIEAAHVRWHAEGGPDEVSNGLSLCVLHHRLFDYGAFTVRSDLAVSVAASVAGKGFDESLGQFHDRPLLAPPKRGADRPDPAFLEWHQSEVFQMPPPSAEEPGC